MSLLEVNHLSISFLAGREILPVVDKISFQVNKGEILALVGESGCGKSISCMALTGLLPTPPAQIQADSILFGPESDRQNLIGLSPRKMRKVRGGRIAYIFQEPSVSLNPVFRVGAQIAEVIQLHRPEIKDIHKEVLSLLHAVGIPAPETRISAYPHELSGGMQQRIMIAMALAGNPELLIADEPTTALDVTIQAQILELIDRLRKERSMAVILVTHNLGIVASLADRVAVMYAGRIVESASAHQLFANALHPYTRALLSAVPRLGGHGERLSTIPGHVPSPDAFPRGCRFFGRCEECQKAPEAIRFSCEHTVPPPCEIEPGHWAACHLTGAALYAQD